MSLALSDAFRYSKLILATTTYNASIYPFMHDYISRLVEHNFQNRTVGLIENGSWAPLAAKVMREMMAKCKKINWLDTTVKILSAINQDNQISWKPWQMNCAKSTLPRTIPLPIKMT